MTGDADLPDSTSRGRPSDSEPESDGRAVAPAAPVLRRRSSLPWVLSAVSLVVVGAVLWVAVAGVPTWPSGIPGLPGSGSAPPASGGGGSTQSVLANGTVWDVAAGHFESAGFAAAGDSQAFGGFHSSVPVRFWIVAASSYGNWSGTNSTYGTDPSPSSSAGASSNWSAGPATSATLQRVILGPGAYELIVENTNSSLAASVIVVQSVVLQPFDTS